ncbi:hypothetical protein [Oligoflexus tunisiensis]|uniref:hypothetical protein n=1 Tax=Oligoflexus tunisiensis TaxID=708132 RepID=UPI00114D3659|nr:hypothetical protein [Oligoflexus tunisiensis]
MGFKVGDNYFNRDGYPGVIVARDPKTEQLIVEKEGPNFDRARNFGYINGLSPQERGEFETIISEVREKKDPRERVALLQDAVEQLRTDPKKQVLSRYLEGEMSHIMNSEGLSPRIFKIDETKL